MKSLFTIDTEENNGSPGVNYHSWNIYFYFLFKINVMLRFIKQLSLISQNMTFSMLSLAFGSQVTLFMCYSQGTQNFLTDWFVLNNNKEFLRHRAWSLQASHLIQDAE